MNSTLKGFADYFTRPLKFCSTAIYEDRLVATARESADNATMKYQNLFCDCFGHHVQFNLDTPAEIALRVDDTRRYITDDSLTSFFLDRIYEAPNIFETPNSKLEPNSLRSYEYFLRSLTDPPSTRASPVGDTEGSNQISYVVGEMGTGKTLLLCKTVRDVKRQQYERSHDNADTVLLPVYFDCETQMLGTGGQLRNIDEAFYSKMVQAIVRAIEQTKYAKTRVGTLFAESSLTGEARFTVLVRSLHARGVRLLLIIDNLDGYHYYYSKYEFFSEYHKKQVDSTRRNITSLITAFAHSDYHGMDGLSIVFAARRNVYWDCIHANVKPEASTESTGSVYQLQDKSDTIVITSRLQLLEAAIAKLMSDNRLKKVGESYKETLSRLRILLGLSTAIEELKGNREATDTIGSLTKLGHQGNRSLVAFLSSLRLDHRYDGQLIERFFWHKPHTLVLLYIADLRFRYTQAHGHFPNLFLVDALIMKDAEFPKAHVPHIHTYWLNFLILRYVYNCPDQIADVAEIKRLFVELGGYDDQLVKLALGSLSMARDSRCLEPEPATRATIPARVMLTDRGRFLMKPSIGGKSSFCFTFTYLQLIVDDYLMSYPKSIWKDVYSSDVDLGYLFQEQDSYNQTVNTYLFTKMKNVLALMAVLRVSFLAESKLRKQLLDELREFSGDALPDFHQIEDDLIRQFSKILSPLATSEDTLSQLQEFRSRLQRGSDRLKQQMNEYFENRVMIAE